MANIAVIPRSSFAAGTEVTDTSNTAVLERADGYAVRETIRQIPLREFHLTVGPNDTAEVRAIFQSHRRRWPVYIRDMAGYTFTDQVQTLFTTVGSFSYYKVTVLDQPTTGSRFLNRRVLGIDESEETAILKINGVATSRGNWTIDDHAKIKIATSIVGGGEVTLSFMELCAACFTTDELAYKVFAKGQDGAIMGIRDCSLREIPEQELIDLMLQTDDSAGS